MDRVVFNARIIFKTLARLAGVYMAEPPNRCRRILKPSQIIMMIYDYRSGRRGDESTLREISCSLAQVSPGIDASRAELSTLKVDKQLGLHELAASLRKFYEKPSINTLKDAVKAVGSSLAKPCAPAPGIEEELKRLDERMKLLGILLGLTLPVLFLASLIANIVLGVIVIAIAIGLWIMIKRDGDRYQYLNVEKAWHECLFTREVLERTLKGEKPLPSVFEILGIPPPRLD